MYTAKVKMEDEDVLTHVGLSIITVFVWHPHPRPEPDFRCWRPGQTSVAGGDFLAHTQATAPLRTAPSPSGPPSAVVLRSISSEHLPAFIPSLTLREAPRSKFGLISLIRKEVAGLMVLKGQL